MIEGIGMVATFCMASYDLVLGCFCNVTTSVLTVVLCQGSSGFTCLGWGGKACRSSGFQARISDHAGNDPSSPNWPK